MDKLKLDNSDEIRSVEKIYMVFTMDDGTQRVVKVMMDGLQPVTKSVTNSIADILESLDYYELK